MLDSLRKKPAPGSVEEARQALTVALLCGIQSSELRMDLQAKIDTLIRLEVERARITA